MNLTPQEIDALIAATPQTQNNAGVLAMLLEMRRSANVVKYPFTYSAEFYTAGANSNLAAGATGNAVINIDAATPFVIVSQSYYCNTANAAETEATIDVPNIVIALTDSGSNRQLQNRAVPVWAIFGNGKFPYVLPQPKLMQANSQLNIQAVNRDAAVGYNLYLTFNGYQIYRS